MRKADMTAIQLVADMQRRGREPYEAQLRDTTLKIEDTERKIIRYAKLLAKLRARRKYLQRRIVDASQFKYAEPTPEPENC